jgi:uncharacterized membrane protein
MEASSIEAAIMHSVGWLKLGVESVGALIIGIGVAVAAIGFARPLATPRSAECSEVRLTLARYLILGLEFQLGADILASAIAPSWDQIGKLGAIAIIRTALNFFLMKEIHDEH